MMQKLTSLKGSPGLRDAHWAGEHRLEDVHGERFVGHHHHRPYRKPLSTIAVSVIERD